jgi:predicted nucleic acid-binding protein
VKLVFDANVLGRLCNPNPAKSEAAVARIRQLAAAPSSAEFFVPEIADYEVRRELLHVGSTRALAILDRLASMYTYLSIDTSTMRRAAALWAAARRQGRPTAGDGRLDADVVLAAQALGVDGTVATTNVRHLSRYVPVDDWTDQLRAAAR